MMSTTSTHLQCMVAWLQCLHVQCMRYACDNLVCITEHMHTQSHTRARSSRAFCCTTIRGRRTSNVWLDGRSDAAIALECSSAMANTTTTTIFFDKSLVFNKNN